MAMHGPPAEVTQIRSQIKRFLQQPAPNGRPIGSAKCAVYAFYDYDGEPIYVGQTVENLGVRLGRHLTGRRSDAVAKFVLDPFEVLDVEVWPLWDAEKLDAGLKKQVVNEAEFTVFQKALKASRFGAVLNEGTIPRTPTTKLPKAYRGRIVPEALLLERKHPDVRLARRAQTVASLARLISEREIQAGLRRVLLVQAQRLEHLARQRHGDFAGEPIAPEQDDNSDDSL